MDNSGVGEKIKKLLALASDSGATEEEAKTAMEMAQTIAAKYAVDLADLLTNRSDTVALIHRELSVQPRSVDFWWSRIAIAVKYMFSLPVYSKYHTGQWMIAGPSELVDGATDTFNFLVDQIERLYKEALPRGLSQRDRAQFRKNFKWSCASRVIDRAVELTRRLSDQSYAQATVGANALVVVESREALYQTTLKFMADEFGITLVKSRKHQTRNAGYGTSAGRAAGDNVQLRRGLS